MADRSSLVENSEVGACTVGPMIVFDMNETTLDMAEVRTELDSIAPDAGGFIVWFHRLLQSAMTVSATGSDFKAFGDLGRNALEANLARVGRTLSDAAWSRVSDAMGRLRPHADVHTGLERLRASGHPTMALTNSGQANLESICEATGLTPLFDHLVSVEAVQAYKPLAAPYRHAADVAGLPPAQMTMVACHDWDLAGANAVGFRTVFIERPDFSFSASYRPPDLSVPDFSALADALA